MCRVSVDIDQQQLRRTNTQLYILHGTSKNFDVMQYIYLKSFVVLFFKICF